MPWWCNLMWLCFVSNLCDRQLISSCNALHYALSLIHTQNNSKEVRIISHTSFVAPVLFPDAHNLHRYRRTCQNKMSPDDEWIGSNDNSSASCGPPGSLHTLGNKWSYLTKRLAFHVDYNHLHWIYFWWILAAKSIFDVANNLQNVTVKDVPINHELRSGLGNALRLFYIYKVLEQRVHPISSGKLQVLSSSPNIH